MRNRVECTRILKFFIFLFQCEFEVYEITLLTVEVVFTYFGDEDLCMKTFDRLDRIPPKIYCSNIRHIYLHICDTGIFLDFENRHAVIHPSGYIKTSG